MEDLKLDITMDISIMAHQILAILMLDPDEHFDELLHIWNNEFKYIRILN